MTLYQFKSIVLKLGKHTLFQPQFAKNMQFFKYSVQTTLKATVKNIMYYLDCYNRKMYQSLRAQSVYFMRSKILLNWTH